MLTTTWFPIAVTLIVAGAIVGFMTVASRIFGPKRPNPVKGESFE